MTGKQTIWIITVVMLLLTVLFAAAAEGPPPAKVKVAPVTQDEVAQTRTVIGVLYYERISQISTELAALVETVKVSEGETVKQGEPLVILNTEILDKEIDFQKARLEQIELRIANLKKNYDRLELLYGKQGVSERERDNALFEYKNAQVEKEATEANLQKLQIQKKRSIISAPFSGIILTKDVDSGSWVQPGKVLVSIGSSEDLYIRAPISETILQYIEIGQQLPITINAFGKELTGILEDIDPVADMKTKNIYLKISIEPLDLVAQNMSATVTVPASERRKLSIISRASLVTFQGKDFVYTVKDGNASILPVNIVAYLGETVAVDNPYIAPGMPLVIEGNERLRPDQPVTIEE
jgi:membrane fusion protein, multidrug efflux system